MTDPLFPVEFRAAWVYRRLGVYLSVGALLFAGTLLAVERVMRGFGQPPKPGAEYVAAAAAACSVLGIGPFYWKLRVDQHGISRRRWCGWDHWPWEEFAHGRFQVGRSSLAFVDARAAWFCPRRLDLGLLAQADKEQVLRWIERVWVPPPIEVPEEISLTYLGTSVHCTTAGIAVTRGRKTADYSWGDVESLQIVRDHHRDDDFRWLTLKVPDWEMRLRCNQGSSRWLGPDAETVSRFLTAHVSDDRLLMCARLDPPRSAREADVRVDDTWKKMDSAKKFSTGCYVVLAGLCEWYSLTRQPMALSIMAIALQPAILIYMEYRLASKDYEKHVQWQQELYERLDDCEDQLDESSSLSELSTR